MMINDTIEAGTQLAPITVRSLRFLQGFEIAVKCKLRIDRSENAVTGIRGSCTLLEMSYRPLAMLYVLL